MGSAEWLAATHPMLVHMSLACAMLLPIALIAAMRQGRGIKPWRLTCRYLAWMGLLASLAALLSGWYMAKLSGALPTLKEIFTTLPAPAETLRMHQLLALLGCLAGLACLKSMYLRREEHEGIGALALFLGLLWVGLSMAAARFLYMAHHPASALVLAKPAQPQPQPRPEPQPPPGAADPEAKAPWRALDYASLVPIHTEPVKSPAHGNRWIRAWASPEAAEAYRSGTPLPNDSLVVMSTLEDRWGRPGFEEGPLYALEMKDGKPFLTFYWPRVPEAKRAETGGAERAYSRGDDPSLQSCLACHASGIAPVKDRSKRVVPRKPKAERAQAVEN